MENYNLQQIESKEMVPGFHARFVHSPSMTFAYWDVEAGSSLPDHTHEHEQVLNLLEGRFEVTVDGEIQVLEAGSVVVLPSNVPHSGSAITDCRILDVFHPVREDYR
jgi:quercetin dioxygenase-like cupin family protein